jgi:glycerophosphoryl diester phosphodiesterase
MSTVVAGLMLTSISGQAISPAERLLAQPRPLVIAHRGYSSAAPENTLPAFQLAVTAGADMVELDYHHSRDGILTVLHDYTLDRTTDAIRRWGGTNLNVSKYAFDQLRELDAATWRGSNQPPAGIPKLIDALDLIQKGSVTLIERKAGPAADCVALLREKKLMNQVVLQAFDREYLEQCVQRQLPLSPASPRDRPTNPPYLSARPARVGPTHLHDLRTSRDQSGS